MGIVVPCKTIHDGGPRLWLRLSPGMGLPRLAINMAGGGMTVQSPRNTDLNAPLRLPTMDNICQGPLLGAVMALGNQGKNATHGGSALVYSYGRGCRTTEENGLCMTDSFSTQPIKLTSRLRMPSCRVGKMRKEVCKISSVPPSFVPRRRIPLRLEFLMLSLRERKVSSWKKCPVFGHKRARRRRHDWERCRISD